MQWVLLGILIALFAVIEFQLLRDRARLGPVGEAVGEGGGCLPNAYQRPMESRLAGAWQRPGHAVGGTRALV